MLTRDWIDQSSTHWYRSNVKTELLAASQFFGHGVISTFGEGNVSVKIQIQDVVTPKIAEALEIDPDVFVFVNLDFSNGWQAQPTDRIPYPIVEVTQHSVKGGGPKPATNFGMKYHLSSIISRYIEDVWKFSNFTPTIDLGSFNENKGINNKFQDWKKEREEKKK
jgi:hypothetical protein